MQQRSQLLLKKALIMKTTFPGTGIARQGSTQNRGVPLGSTGCCSQAAQPLEISRPGYHPATLLKIYAYGYLNRVPSSRRLERECQRNVELVWLTGGLAPDFKTIADFRKDNYWVGWRGGCSS